MLRHLKQPPAVYPQAKPYLTAAFREDERVCAYSRCNQTATLPATLACLSMLCACGTITGSHALKLDRACQVLVSGRQSASLADLEYFPLHSKHKRRRLFDSSENACKVVTRECTGNGAYFSEQMALSESIKSAVDIMQQCLATTDVDKDEVPIGCTTGVTGDCRNVQHTTPSGSHQMLCLPHYSVVTDEAITDVVGLLRDSSAISESGDMMQTFDGSCPLVAFLEKSSSPDCHDKWGSLLTMSGCESCVHDVEYFWDRVVKVCSTLPMADCTTQSASAKEAITFYQLGVVTGTKTASGGTRAKSQPDDDDASTKAPVLTSASIAALALSGAAAAAVLTAVLAFFLLRKRKREPRGREQLPSCHSELFVSTRSIQKPTSCSYPHTSSNASTFALVVPKSCGSQPNRPPSLLSLQAGFTSPEMVSLHPTSAPRTSSPRAAVSPFTSICPSPVSAHSATPDNTCAAANTYGGSMATTSSAPPVHMAHVPGVGFTETGSANPRTPYPGIPALSPYAGVPPPSSWGSGAPGGLTWEITSQHGSQMSMPPFIAVTAESPPVEILNGQLDWLMYSRAGRLSRVVRLIGRYGRRLGANGAMAYAHVVNNESRELAIKFYVEVESFDKDVAMMNVEAIRRAMPPIFTLEDSWEALNTQHFPAPLNSLPLPPMLITDKGEPLDEFVDRSHPDFFTSLQFLVHIGRKLEALHHAGWVHRDVKPPNTIWLPLSNEWALTDFGCAAQTGEPASMTFSAYYAPPEVIRAYSNRQPSIVAHPSADVWSLGIIAWELFTETMFFGKDAGLETVMATLEGSQPLASEVELSSDVKARLGNDRFRESVLTMLSRDATLRPSMSLLLSEWSQAFQYSASLR